MSDTLKPHVFEKGDMLYIVAPVTPFTPGQSEIEEFAFAKNLKDQAPNENLLWLRGQYVEADQPNRNGQMWTAGELAINAVTPNFMPVTVMHDPRTAVGLIADTDLKVPDKDGVPRARIETALALWKHRFPEVVEEAAVNYEAGTLMQSMECHSPHYSCAECGQTYQKLPKGAERENWCEHLAEMADRDGYTYGARILGNVTFTGTGLIFGTRGARGALDTAHLDVFEEQVAEYHESAHREGSEGTGTRRKTDRKVTGVETVEISKSEYDSLKADKAKLEETEGRLQKAEEEKAEAVKTSEEAEANQKKVEDERDDLKKKVEEADENKRKSELAKDRIGTLGSEFLGKLGEKTRERVNEQAAAMSDEDWDARLTELEELTAVKRDAKKEGDEGDEGGSGSGEGEEFSREEVARSQSGNGNGGGSGKEPSLAERRSVTAGLIGGKPKAKGKSE